MIRSAEARSRGSGLAAALSVALLLPATGTAEPEYSEESGRACIDCHETPRVMGILETAHANFDDPRTPAAQKQCQSCHGPSAKHMRFPMQVANLHFGKASKDPPQAQNQRCLACHATDSGKKDWHASAHGFENVVCSSCHSLHDPARIVPARATLSTGCTESCHADLMAGADPSDFPHTIELLACTDCHDPHGPLGSGRCTTCHPRTPDEVAAESAKARRFHAMAEEKGTGCILCHKGIAHPIPELVLEESAAVEEPDAR